VHSRAWSTTSSCAATTAPTPTTSRSSSTTPSRASARSCAAPTCWTRRRASCGWASNWAQRRRDGVVAYNLAVVVDDAEQGIEEVVRGDDLLPATAAQALLCDLLGLTRPAWAHVPLVLGPDGERLATRHGAVTLAELADRGIDSGEALAWMARSLDLAAPGEPVTATGLVARFDPDRIPAEPTTFARIRP
jgi:glutamyl-tRNA synthetase